MTNAVQGRERIGPAELTTGALKTGAQVMRHEAQEGGIDLATSKSPRAGMLTFDGDLATLTFERTIRHPVEAVWEAITEPKHLALWYMTDARLDPRPGGTIDFRTGPARLRATGKILTWEPPRVFEHEWNVEPANDFPQGERSIVRWELTPVAEGTLLRFSHRRLTRQTAIVFAGGMHAFLDRLEDQLDGRPASDWMARVQEVRPEYPRWGSGGEKRP